MDGYLLSYNPNDFFWVSVQNQFDFTQCPRMLDSASLRNKGSGVGVTPTPGSQCPVVTCPAAPSAAPPTKVPNEPTATPTPNPTYLFNQLYMNAHTPTQAATSGDITGDFAKQLCKNHAESQRLLALQDNLSTTQARFSDTHYDMGNQIQGIVNMAVGIVIACIVGGVAARE
uniref:Uncharacterized protein n=1 Tax=viral metagenome TaxID=1070528 RepID=A0A6C0EQY2_9ZZZZ